MNTVTKLPRKDWALVQDGRVVAVSAGAVGHLHPYGILGAGLSVLDTTGVECRVGFVTDAKGNVGPAPGTMDEAPARHTAVMQQALHTGEPHPLERTKL